MRRNTALALLCTFALPSAPPTAHADPFTDDSDGDGVPDAYDRCLLGDDALDHDHDGLPDACDALDGPLFPTKRPTRVEIGVGLPYGWIQTARHACVEDVSGDGRADLIFVAHASGKDGIAVRCGLEGGGFGPAKVASSGTVGATGLLVGNFLGDDRSVLLNLGRYATAVFAVDETGQPSLRASGAGWDLPDNYDSNIPVQTVADLNGDGFDDVVLCASYDGASGYLGVSVNNGDGTFESTPIDYQNPIYAWQAWSSVVRVGGREELAIFSAANGWPVLYRWGLAEDGEPRMVKTLAESPDYDPDFYYAYGTVTVPGDIDGDGVTDFMTRTWNMGFREDIQPDVAFLSAAAPGGAWVHGIRFHPEISGDGTHWLLDMDHDGRDDLVSFPSYGGPTLWHKSLGDGRFECRGFYRMSDTYWGWNSLSQYGPEQADINGDGLKDDYVWERYYTALYVEYADPSHPTGPTQPIVGLLLDEPGEPFVANGPALVRDTDLDGRDELVLVGSSSCGTAFFQDATLEPGAPPVFSSFDDFLDGIALASGDFNGDGIQDYCVTGEFVLSGSYESFHKEFTDEQAYSRPDAAMIAADLISDPDHPRRDELVTTRRIGGVYSLDTLSVSPEQYWPYLTVEASTPLPGLVPGRRIVFVDWNHDGFRDLALTLEADETRGAGVLVLTGREGGAFDVERELRLPRTGGDFDDPKGLATGDINLDGLDDIALVTGDFDRCRLHTFDRAADAWRGPKQLDLVGNSYGGSGGNTHADVATTIADFGGPLSYRGVGPGGTGVVLMGAGIGVFVRYDPFGYPVSIETIDEPTMAVHAVPFEMTGDGAPDLVVSATSPAGFIALESRVNERTVADLTTSSGHFPPELTRGLPDGIVDGADLSYFIEEWLAHRLAADLTTLNANPGDPGYGISDRQIDGADLFYYVEAWLAGS